ncbi:MAG: hypothetical protein ACHQIL_03430 [Steroidobacterales bacterium]
MINIKAPGYPLFLLDMCRAKIKGLFQLRPIIEPEPIRRAIAQRENRTYTIVPSRFLAAHSTDRDEPGEIEMISISLA